MKVARRISLGVLLLAMFLALNTSSAPPVSAATITRKVVNANDGLDWRSQPDWNTPIQDPQPALLTEDTLVLVCYQWGSTIPSYSNKLWYWAWHPYVWGEIGYGEGWINDHFVDTGTNQPNIPVPGVPA